MKTCRGILYLFTLLLLASCGTARRAAVQQSTAPVIPPLEDPAEIARSQERAREVMDSVARVREEMSAKAEETPEEEPFVLVDEILDYARTFIGTPYKLGAAGPKQFDCSGFTRYVFREFGIDLPMNSALQYKNYPKVESFVDLQKGDLVFFGARKDIRNVGHVGIVTDVDLERGIFYFIHAGVSHGVEEQRSTHPYFMMRYIGAVRVLPEK